MRPPPLCITVRHVDDDLYIPMGLNAAGCLICRRYRRQGRRDDYLFECSNTSRSCYRLGAKMGSHLAKSRQESGGVWTVICPGKQDFANLLDSSRPARGLLHTEEVTGSIPVSPTQLSGQLRSCNWPFWILVQQQSAAAGSRSPSRATGRACRVLRGWRPRVPLDRGAVAGREHESGFDPGVTGAGTVGVLLLSADRELGSRRLDSLMALTGFRPTRFRHAQDLTGYLLPALSDISSQPARIRPV